MQESRPVLHPGEGHDPKWYSTVTQSIELIRSDASDEARAEAAKKLAGLASSENTNDRMNKQNMIVDAGAGSVLINLMLHGATENERWWGSLALVQLTFGNERTIERLVDVSVLGSTTVLVKRWMIGDEAVEDEMTEEEDRECLVRAASKVLANEVAYATDRIKYGAIHILTNIANKCWEVQDVIFAHGAVRRVVPLCKTSNTPALVAAGVGLLCSMSYRERSRTRLMKAGAVRVLEPIARSERQDLNGVSANIARSNLRRHAASIMAALARGHIDRKRLRKEAEARKMRRLARFMGNLVFYKCFKNWVAFKDEAIDHREKMKMSVKRLLNRTLIWALQNLSKYVDRRHNKYDKHDRALAFADKSLVARNRMLAMWKEFMVKHGSWWSPDDEMEDKVKQKCASFVALMAGQWVNLCFAAWKELLEKKHRAMRRWQNSAIFLGFQSWSEYMYTEGAWWEPDEELKRLLDQKCGRFLAAMSGDYVQAVFSEWHHLIKKKKRASQRWFNRCATNAFDEWHDKVFVEMYELYEQVHHKCGKVLALISGEYVQMCFDTWKEGWEMEMKGKRFLLGIKNRPLRIAYDIWIDFMCQGSWWEPDDDMQALLNDKCGNLIAMMSGDFSRLVLSLWHDVAHKQVQAMRRWKNQSLFAAWSDWVHFHSWQRHFARCTRVIRERRRVAAMQEGMWELISCFDERLHRRSLVGDALRMWLSFRVVWAFRTLDEHCQTEKHHRMVLARFRHRYEMRPAQRCTMAWREYTNQQIRLRLLVHRIKNAAVVSCLHQWQDLLQETKIATRERMVAKSPLLVRWIKRPMHNCWNYWKNYVAQEIRNRHILKRMKLRLEQGCVVETFNNWNLFVDIVVHERFAGLKAAVADALQTGTLSVLMSSLRREQQLFHRTNVRWNEFARAYLEDALEEFSAEEARQVETVYKRIRRRKMERDREQEERAAQFLYVPHTRRAGSKSPPRQPRGGGGGASPSPVQAVVAQGQSPAMRRPAERGVGGLRQVMPAYMMRGSDYRPTGAQREQLARDGMHMKHELHAKERAQREERERAKKAALRREQEAKQRWMQEQEAQQSGQPEGDGGAPRRAWDSVPPDPTWGIKDARYYSENISSFTGYSEKNPPERPSSALSKSGSVVGQVPVFGGGTGEEADGAGTQGTVAQGIMSPAELSVLSSEGGVTLPAIESTRQVHNEESEWPWVDRKAVSFAMGVDDETFLPQLVPQKSAVIL